MWSTLEGRKERVGITLTPRVLYVWLRRERERERERERMTKSKAKARSGAVRVSSSESPMMKKKTSTSGSGLIIKKKGKMKNNDVELDFDLEEYGRKLRAKTMEALAKMEDEEKKKEDEKKPKPKPKPKLKPKKKKLRSVGERRKTRLQTEKERDAKVKISFPGGKGKDPRLNAVQELREFMSTTIVDLDTSGSESEPEDPVAAYNLLRQCVGPHIDIEDLEKHDMYVASLWGTRTKKANESLLKDLEKNGARYRAELDLEVSKKALAFFNKEHNFDYELVETLGSFTGEYDGKWVHHCNFKAQKCPQLEDSRPLPKLFFGELFSWLDDRGENVYDVRSCYVLDFCPTVRGCEICPKPIRHPKDKFVKSDKNWPY